MTTSIPIPAASAHFRSLYRSLLRELPPTTTTGTPLRRTPLRTSIRQHFSPAPASPSSAAASDTSTSETYSLARRQELEQFVQYLRAQRMYGTLLERYNPGMGMDEEERVRLTARRVGMDLPVEWYGKKK